MQAIESRRQRRRHGYPILAAGLLLFGALFVVGGLAPADLAWLPVSLGFTSLVLCTARALAIWNVDALVFDHGRPSHLAAAAEDAGRRRTREAIARFPLVHLGGNRLS